MSVSGDQAYINGGTRCESASWTRGLFQAAFKIDNAGDTRRRARFRMRIRGSPVKAEVAAAQKLNCSTRERPKQRQDQTQENTRRRRAPSCDQELARADLHCRSKPAVPANSVRTLPPQSSPRVQTGGGS